MKKIILLVFLVVIVVISGYIIISQKNNDEIIPYTEKETVENNTELNLVKLEGTVTDIHNGCWSDGICSIEVDGKWWIPIIKGGLMPPDSKPEIQGEVVGIVFNENNESLGKKVEVNAKKVDENYLTIFGSKDYYVRVINE